MTTALPVLESDRLIIRPFVEGDLETIHGVLSRAWDAPGDGEEGLARRRHWLRWTVASNQQLAALDQPPYGDRAIESRESGGVIGSVGLVPSLGPFGQLPGFPANPGSRYFFPEVGLYWAVDPAHQGLGYATEAAKVLVEAAFVRLNLGRLVATTERTNGRSMAVMRKLGMRILENTEPSPHWFQIVGLLQRD